MQPPSAIKQLFATGLALRERGELGEAELCFQKILLLDPKHAASLHCLGAIALQRGGNARAAELLARAVALDERNADSHQQLGAALAALGRSDEAVSHLRRAVELKPGHAQAHLHLGHALQAAGKADEAASQYRAYSEALTREARTALARGRTFEAVALVGQALQAARTDNAKTLFIQAVRQLDEFPDTLPIAEFLPAAMSEPWCRPADLAPLAVGFLRVRRAIADLLARAASPGFHMTAPDWRAVAGDRLLRALLENTPVCDAQFERLITLIRRRLLELAAAGGAVEPALADFAAALARQCFINEYVFALADDEMRLADAQRKSLAAALSSGADLPPLTVAAVAAYHPLGAIAGGARLFERAWPDALSALLVQQIREPEQDRQARESIPRLTAIDDDVSQKVQGQYEENPYPRWVKVAPVTMQMTFDAYLRNEFPLARFRAAPSLRDVLIAGCGTGQHAVETAQFFTGASVLAVDLSRASLAYASRKTREMGLTNIEYAQADLLKLQELGRSFDVIQTVGVLHHLADPMAGWRTLLGVLRTGGFMQIGLYSALGRADVNAARALAVARGLRADADGIRRCRQEIMALPEGHPARSVAKATDWFSTSGCRDLLFHVQEQQLTLPQIAGFIAENDLRFLGLQVGPRQRAAYAARFPKDRAMTDLDNWHIFETENPRTFIAMYFFWVQKP